jgi:hypothetical protein
METTPKKRVVTKTEVKTMEYLNRRGYSNVKIGALMGLNESTVRRSLAAEKTQTA